MLAIEVDGITSVDPIGDDVNQLSWQNTHRRDARLLLTVMDSNGSIAGFPGQFFNVIAASAGADTSCLIAAPTPSTPVITANVTQNLQTCQPWGLSITGGTKPYNVTLGQLNAPVITNVTMGPEDDVFTYINRASPNQPLIDCPGLVSISSTKEQVAAQEAAAAAAAQKTANKAHATTIALAIVFGVILPILIVAGVGFWWWRRRKRLLSHGRASSHQNTKPSPYDPEQQNGGAGRPSLNLDMSQVHSHSVLRVNSEARPSATWAVDAASDIEPPLRQTDSPTSMDMSTTELRQTIPTPYLTPTTLARPAPTIKSPRSPPDLAGPGALMTSNSTSPAATLTPEARYRKALEAHAGAQAARARLISQTSLGSSVSGQSPVAGPSTRPALRSNSGPPAVMPRAVPMQRSQSALVMRTFPGQPLPRRGGASLRLPPVAAISEDENGIVDGPDIIIQHRDGGIVEELPPPYLDSYSPRARARASAGGRPVPGTPRSAS
ncbi:hypothetical protein TRAPUB_3474 [Trametes pubescens]|uniref:Uncharacterized protein n=1 Tax=Trametes pubescens TaxID=154538 RepID=A0A1M2VDT6_TRAPU|nr:hypothetical protein TRAPUB_3474 [Trametes pubescens]